MPTIAQLDFQNHTVMSIFQSDNSNVITGPEMTVVIDGKNPMPSIGWTTSDHGLTFQAPAPDSPVANYTTIIGKLNQALTANANYLAIPTPSQAQVVQQVDRLTRECTGLIRAVLGLYDSQSGT